MAEKECGKCHQILPESEFHRNSAKIDGLAWACKTCMSEYGKSRNLVEVRKRVRDWKKQHPDKVRAQKRRAKERAKAAKLVGEGSEKGGK